MRTAQVYLAYVDWIGEGDTTRSEAAQYFGVTKSTATYHLAKAVENGYLEKFYAWTRANQTGWAYRATGSERPITDEECDPNAHGCYDACLDAGAPRIATTPPF